MKNNRFRDIITVTKFTMRDLISRKSFRVSTILILILIIAGFNVPNIMDSLTGGDYNDTILISDPENLYDNKLEILNQSELGYNFTFDPISYDEIKAKIDDGSINAAVMIGKAENTVNFTYVVSNEIGRASCRERV